MMTRSTLRNMAPLASQLSISVGFIGPCHIEDVGDILYSRELGFGVFEVRDIALDVVNGMVSVCDAVDLPWTARCVREGEDLS